jgi:hypothetical protein
LRLRLRDGCDRSRLGLRSPCGIDCMSLSPLL